MRDMASARRRRARSACHPAQQRASTAAGEQGAGAHSVACRCGLGFERRPRAPSTVVDQLRPARGEDGLRSEDRSPAHPRGSVHADWEHEQRQAAGRAASRTHANVRGRPRASAQLATDPKHTGMLHARARAQTAGLQRAGGERTKRGSSRTEVPGARQSHEFGRERVPSCLGIRCRIGVDFEVIGRLTCRRNAAAGASRREAYAPWMSRQFDVQDHAQTIQATSQAPTVAGGTVWEQPRVYGSSVEVAAPKRKLELRIHARCIRRQRPRR